MAGNYPDVPSRRMAWDDDGSVVLGYYGFDSGVPAVGVPPPNLLTDQSTVDKQAVNGEDNTGVYSGGQTVRTGGVFWYVFFPEKRELDGYYRNMAGTNEGNGLSWSENSTNGRDGSFTAWGTADYDNNIDVDPNYRDNIASTALSNKRVVYSQQAWSSGLSAESTTLRAFHIYGRITPGDQPDRFLFLDVANNDAEYTVLVDYGNIPRGQTQTLTVKVVNNSSGLTANTVQLTATGLVGASDDWYTFSIDAGPYQATAQLGNIGPGGERLVTYKQAIPDAEVLGLHAARFKILQASWS